MASCDCNLVGDRCVFGRSAVIHSPSGQGDGDRLLHLAWVSATLFFSVVA